MTGSGHEDQFPLPTLNARCRFSQGTFAGTQGNGRDAPIPAVRGTAIPLVLTSAKPMLFCQTQHRALPSLRKRALYPEVELHPAAARARGIAAGEWVRIETPEGSVRARARLNDSLDPRVVVGEHGWS